MSEHIRPPKKYPRGHCANVMRISDDPMRTIKRLETTRQCRAWLAKLNEIDADVKYKEAVAERYDELS